MQRISVFDMFKIGVGPSSSHTLGPWKVALQWLQNLQQQMPLQAVEGLEVHLFGSLALTGRGHATDVAVIMGLLNQQPETVETEQVPVLVQLLRQSGELVLGGRHPVPFRPKEHIIFHFDKALDFHANGMQLRAFGQGKVFEETWYSIGGGFIVKEGEDDVPGNENVQLPYPCDNGEQLMHVHRTLGLSIEEIVWQNELCWHTAEEVKQGLMRIWHTMETCIYKGCHAFGELPGGLNVTRRAANINKKMLNGQQYHNSIEWIRLIKQSSFDFDQVLRWISCFALAVNEENAAMGRVVTAPTNGAAGVIPAVIMYYFCFKNRQATNADIVRFLLVAGEIGSYFKRGATISAAMGGCQAEIGVSSAMAAAGLCACMGGTTPQVLMAAEIAMEHHLGLTCDPVGGLVQIPCIERNSMGAVKAITAAKIALESDPEQAKVPLDKVISTMWETAQNMDSRYKETSRGGLAANIPVNLPEC